MVAHKLKTNLALGVALAVLMGISVLSFRDADQLIGAAGDVAHSKEVLAGVKELESAFNEMVLIHSSYALKPDNATAERFETATKTSIAAGFSMIRVIPLGLDSSLTDSRALKAAQQNSQLGAHCDYNFSVAATSTNSEQISQMISEVGSLFLPFNHLSGNISKVATVTTHFSVWPPNKLIITDAKTTDLASVLLLASLHSRKMHITSVTTQDDISLIALSKEKGLRVTCDVAVYSLFLTQDDYPQCTFLPTDKDQRALWAHMSIIDVFSIGSIPYQLARETEQELTPALGAAETIPLLFTAVAEGRLAAEDITARLHDNPKRIFELHDQPGTSVEIEVDRAYVFQPGEVWSPFAGKVMRGAVRRVVFQNKTVCLDGQFISDASWGKDMSGHVTQPSSPIARPHPHPETPHTKRQYLLSPQLMNRSSAQTKANELQALQALPGAAIVPEDLGPPMYPPLSSVSTSLYVLLRSSPFKQRHVLSVNQFARSDLHLLFTVAQEMRLAVQRQGILDVLKGRLLTTMFFEPSTRTSASFDAAMQRLGGRTIAITTSHSSVQKGETLQDTIRTLGCYGDAIVLRHPDESSAATAAKFSPVPIINGGNGSLEHPTLTGTTSRELL